MNYVKWLKLCISVPLAMAVAETIGLSYAPSAGIITLLTVFNTRQETFRETLKRVAAFAIMVVLSVGIFGMLGCHVYAYAVFFCLFLLLCYLLRLETAIAMNAVLATHFLSSRSVEPAMIGNEVLLFVIGAGTGVLVNLIMPGNLKKIRQRQKDTDAYMRKILTRMSEYLCREDRSDYTGTCFAEVEELLAQLEAEAITRMRNTMNAGDRYFLKYMHMRTRQCESLKDIYAAICELTGVPAQAYAISAFIGRIGESFHEMNNVEDLLAELNQLEDSYKEAQLPASRTEFENRAVLFSILRCLGTFLREKQIFVKELTEEERTRYWVRSD